MKKSDSDFKVEDQTLDTSIAKISTREMQFIQSDNAKVFMVTGMDKDYKVDAKSFIERPFFVDAVKFNTSSARYSLLNSVVKFLPGDIARSNSSILNMFKMAAYGRPNLVLNISMAGTITHSGCVLVGVLPPMPKYPISSNLKLINTILSGPHAFLYANEATSVVLEVPWFCNTDIATTDMELDPNYVNTLDITQINGNYATLVYFVLNPLVPSTGSSIELTIVVEACFKAFDLYVPTPRFVQWEPQSLNGLLTAVGGRVKNVVGDALDNVGKGLLNFIGLHNPNKPHIKERMIVTNTNFVNNVDVPQFFEKLDPYASVERVVAEPLFGSDLDEMAVSHIVNKRQMIGSFKVSTNSPVGQIVWCRPISPFQGGIGVDFNNRIVANNIELMHSLSRAWSGGLELEIVSVMNNKQQCKLKVLKMYNPSLRALSAVPTYQSIANAPSHLMEFTQGGQSITVDLPFLCRNKMVPCSPNMEVEGLFHGMYYVYVAQPLVISDSSPDTIEFNVFIRGKSDLTFYGYTSNIVEQYNYGLYSTSFQAQSGSIEVMNKPQVQTSDYDKDSMVRQTDNMERLMPLMDIKPLVRRVYKQRSDVITVDPHGSVSMTIPLSSFVGENQQRWYSSPLECVSRMFYGKSVGFKFRCIITVKDFGEETIQDLTKVSARFYYLPQAINIDSLSRTIIRSDFNDAEQMRRYAMIADGMTNPNAPMEHRAAYEAAKTTPEGKRRISDVIQLNMFKGANVLTRGNAQTASDVTNIIILGRNFVPEGENFSALQRSVTTGTWEGMFPTADTRAKDEFVKATTGRIATWLNGNDPNSYLTALKNTVANIPGATMSVQSGALVVTPPAGADPVTVIAMNGQLNTVNSLIRMQNTLLKRDDIASTLITSTPRQMEVGTPTQPPTAPITPGATNVREGVIRQGGEPYNLAPRNPLATQGGPAIPAGSEAEMARRATAAREINAARTGGTNAPTQTPTTPSVVSTANSTTPWWRQ